MSRKTAAALEPLAPLIHEIRGERVILDSDLARVYGVEPRALNQAVKRNRERFPSDFVFQLTGAEAENLKSQTVISSSQDFDDGSVMLQPVVGSHGGRRRFPWAFTEHGEALLIVWRQIKELMQRPAVPPPAAPKRRIGFHS